MSRVDMNFKVLNRGQKPPNSGKNTAYLTIDYWNDYSFVTMFHLSLHDESGQYYSLGNVKIGFKGQDISQSTHSTISEEFTSLSNNYFSLGVDLDYYKRIRASLNEELRSELLYSLRDIVFDEDNIETAREEDVFRTSLLRGVSLSTIKGQFKRVLEGGVPLTDFKFSYRRPQEEKFAGIDLSFQVQVGSKPSTNIHAIIGRNVIVHIPTACGKAGRQSPVRAAVITRAR